MLVSFLQLHAWKLPDEAVVGDAAGIRFGAEEFETISYGKGLLSAILICLYHRPVTGD